MADYEDTDYEGEQQPSAAYEPASSSNVFDQFDPPAEDYSIPVNAQPTAGQMPSGNVFDQFDAPPAKSGDNVFDQFDQKPEAENPLVTAGRHFVHALPAMATGALAGAAYGTLGGPGGMLGGALAGGAAAFGESYLQGKATEALFPEEAQRLQAGTEANPISATVGSVGAVAPFFGTGLIKGGATLGQRAVSALLSGGTDVGQQLAFTGTVDPTQAAINTAGGALFAGPPTALGRKVMGIKEPVPHGSPGPEAAAGVSETPAAPPIGDEPKNTRDYGKDTKPTEPGAGVNVGEVDPTLAHALEQSTPEIDAAVRRATGTEAPLAEPAGAMELPPVEVRPEGVAPIESARYGTAASPKADEAVATSPVSLERVVAAVRSGELPLSTGSKPGLRPAQKERVIQSYAESLLERAKTDPQLAADLQRLEHQEPSAVPPKAAEAVATSKAAERAPDDTMRGPIMDARLDEIGAGGTAAAPGKLRETAAQLREQGQEGRAKQFEQAAQSIERSQQQQQQQQQGTAPSAKPTLRMPREQLVEEGKIGDAKAMDAAKAADTELHKLVTEPAGEQYRYKDLVKEAAKIHPEAKGTGGEKLYEAVTSGTLGQQPSNLQQALKHFDSLRKESADIRKKLVARGKIEHEPDDPNYMHRLMKSLPERISDPISEVQGKLPGMRDPSSTKELAFRGAAAKDGERLVLSGQGDRIAVMKNKTPEGYIDSPHETGGLKTGDKITYNGKEYTVDRGREREIEQHAVHKDGTPVEYHKNAFASIIAEHQEMKMMKGYYDWLDNFKGQNSPFREYMTRSEKEAKDRGWKQSEVPDLKGLYLHPNLEQAIHNNYNPGMKGGLDLDAARAINQFAVRSIFWNPVPHSMNALYHYVVGRGWDVIPYTPTKIKNFLQSTFEGFNSAIRQDQLLQNLNKAGASLVMSKIDRQSLIPKIGKLLETELKNNPGPWEAYARKYGLGKGIDAVKLWYDGAQRALWTFGDALMVSRIRELEMGGMSRKDAIEHTRVHMPDYRLPIEFLGSKAMVRFMSDNRVSIFGRYHMGMINSLSEMVTKTLGPNASMTERKEALGNVFALGVLGLVAKPALDNLAQMVTGNKDAEVRPRGPLAPITGLKEFVTGKKDMGQVMSNIFTLSPAIKLPQAVLTNRDFAGLQIVEPGSPLPKKVGQAAEHFAGTMVSPYATFGPTVQPKTAKGDFLHELGSQVFDIKNPTARQKQGEKMGERFSKSAAEKRAKKPRGLIEYGVEQAGRAIR